MTLSGLDSRWTCQVCQVHISDKLSSHEASVWTVVWSHARKLDSGSSRQKPFCLGSSSGWSWRISCYINQGIVRPGKPEASVCLALSSPAEIQLPLVWLDFTPKSHIAQKSQESSGQGTELASECLLNVSKGHWFMGSMTDGAFGFASYFKMGFNSNDWLTMGVSVGCLWVANCCSFVRTWVAFSCRVKGLKTCSSRTISASKHQFSRQCLQQFCEFGGIRWTTRHSVLRPQFLSLRGRAETLYPLKYLIMSIRENLRVV